MEVLDDVMKAMGFVSFHENDSAFLDRNHVFPRSEPRPAADDEVDLFLPMRLLRIQSTGGQNVESDTQVRTSQELEIGLAGGALLVQQLRKLTHLHD
jgi:hypothetical protein